MAYGNLALDLILKGTYGVLVVLKNGRYSNVPIDVVTTFKKVVNVKNIMIQNGYVRNIKVLKCNLCL